MGRINYGPFSVMKLRLSPICHDRNYWRNELKMLIERVHRVKSEDISVSLEYAYGAQPK